MSTTIGSVTPDANRSLAHHLRRAGDLVDRLALHAQGDEEAGDLRRRRLALISSCMACSASSARSRLPPFRPLWQALLDQASPLSSYRSRGALQKVAQQIVAVPGEDGFGVELHALDRQRAVAHAQSVISPSSVQAVISRHARAGSRAR
ncbi:MAG: hypothetical protein MPW14_07770 [Candidatus Manganitrophus sp.]|nr:MAG: hypothetical protein MPW14_07770 [Candidatus Manganitrophus sp.]